MDDGVLVELLDEREGIGVVDGDGALAGVGDPDGAVLIVDGHPVDSVASPLERLAVSIGGGRIHIGNDVLLVGERVGIELDQRGLRDGRAPHRRGDVQGVAAG